MAQLVETVMTFVITASIFVCGFQMLAYAVGISRTHPMTFIGKVIGGLLMGVVRLPLYLLSGIAGTLFQRRRRRRLR
ncbi:MAG: hypothetical protein BMS9Abin05_2689 [Rhodothermia bacterium]|nr:MAG: hypothetical protein BMS9Abin05_2689 [Rhodothermia bacterium]